MDLTNCVTCELTEELRRRGFAVVVFNRDELRGVDPISVEDMMRDRGTNTINDLCENEDAPE